MSKRAEENQAQANGSVYRRHLLPLFVFLFACLIYANSAWNDFTLDDDWVVSENPLIRSLVNIPTLFTSDYWEPRFKGGLYRPLTTASYALNYFLGGRHPASYHVVNILLHALNSLLVLLLFRRLTQDELVSCAGAFLFAAHAVHTEAVANIVGRAELLCFLFLLIGLLLYMEARRAKAPNSPRLYGASLVAYLMALLCKENAITFMGVLVLYDFVYGDWKEERFSKRLFSLCSARLLRVYSGFALVTVSYLVVRFLVLTSGESINPTSELDNPLGSLEPSLRVLNALYIAFHYLWLLVFPLHLSYDYSYNQIPMLTSFLDPYSLITLALSAASVIVIIWSYRASMTLFFAIGFAVITFSIVSNVFVLVGTIIGERLLYLPSFGFCLGLSIFLRWGFGRLNLSRNTQRTLFVGLFAVIVGLHGWRAVVRNSDWQTDSSLLLHDLKVSPNSVKVRTNAGVTLLSNGRFEDALNEFKKAVAIRPQRAKAHRGWGDALFKMGREDEAIGLYEKALSLGSKNVWLYNNLGYLLVDKGIDVERGLRLIEKAVKEEPENPIFLDSLGWTYFKMGRIREAYDLIKRALEYDKLGLFEQGLREHLEEIEQTLRSSQAKEK